MTPEDIAYAAFGATPRQSDESDTDWENRVARTGQKSALAVSNPETTIMRAIARAIPAPDDKPFRATIVDVRLEKRSKRTIVETWSEKNASAGKIVKDEHGDDMPPGHEIIRTPANFPGTIDALVCKELTTRAIALMGHQILVFKILESFQKNGNTLKSRVMLDMRDLGVDDRFEVIYRTNTRGEKIPSRAELV